MMTRMIRPCTLWGETFDACEALHVEVLRTDEGTDVKKNGDVVQVYNDNCDFLLHMDFTPSELNYILHSIHKAIAEALQAPVTWTDEVKEAFNKSHARLKSYRYIVSRYSQYGNITRCKLSNKSKQWNIVDGVKPPICVNKYADSFAPVCAESFKVLLQFYTDGTPVVVQ